MAPKQRTGLLISIKPRYASMIFEGTKTVELRRKEPKVSRGDEMVIYVSSPTMQVTGSATICEVETDTPDRLWRRVKKKAGITREEFDLYFEGAGQAVAIHIEEPRTFRKPMGLQVLQNRMGIRPPQSFRYVTPGSLEAA